MSKFTTGLNPEQCKAVRTIEGPLLVLAGAGTGKTRVITHRIAHMLSTGIPARAILAMTFTNKAAGEMKERISRLVSGKASANLTVGTFHSFCARTLRRFPEKAGVRKRFGICDADDQVVAMKQALREMQIPEKTLQPKVCLQHVSLLKNRLVDAQTLARSDDDWESMIGRAYACYDRGLRASGLLDFDDLLVYVVKLLKDRDMLARFREHYRYLLVDEYQDTNGPQYEIIRQIGGKHRNICVVGDDDQSIYGWRGADVSKILNFEKDFPKATVIRLETNYRSTHQILEAANAVIKNNLARHEKKLHSAVGDGDPIRITKLSDEETEAIFVVEDLVSRARAGGQRLGEFVILFRTQVQPRLFEMQLRERNIPYTLIGGMSFFDRKEVRDVLAYLRLVANPMDELSLLRVINKPPRGIGVATVQKAMTIAAEQRRPLADVLTGKCTEARLPEAAVASAKRFLDMLKALSHLGTGPKLVELIRGVIKGVHYADEIVRCYPDDKTRTVRWDAVNEIMNMAEIHSRRGKKASLSSFLEDLTLSAQDEIEERSETGEDKVTLMTLHSAKGLEFGEVYLVGVEEGLLPHSRSVVDGTVEEERRLAYVGITRARRRLTLTYTMSRARYGNRFTTMPSRFLFELSGKEPPLERMKSIADQQNSPRPRSVPKPVRMKPRAKPTKRASSRSTRSSRRSV